MHRGGKPEVPHLNMVALTQRSTLGCSWNLTFAHLFSSFSPNYYVGHSEKQMQKVLELPHKHIERHILLPWVSTQGHPQAPTGRPQNTPFTLLWMWMETTWVLRNSVRRWFWQETHPGCTFRLYEKGRAHPGGSVLDAASTQCIHLSQWRCLSPSFNGVDDVSPSMTVILPGDSKHTPWSLHFPRMGVHQSLTQTSFQPRSQPHDLQEFLEMAALLFLYDYYQKVSWLNLASP